MSTEDTGERTQKPTARRRREARARGEVARSSDLVTALILFCSTLGLRWLGPGLVNDLGGMMRSALTSRPARLDMQVVVSNGFLFAKDLGISLLPILLLPVAVAASASLIQTGFMWVPTAILPRPERLDIGQGLSRWWSASAWYTLLTSVIKLLVLLGVLLTYGRMRLSSADPLVTSSPPVICGIIAILVSELAVVLSLALVVLAIVDYGYQFWQTERRLMMTIEELRREQREDEANPELKRRRRELATTDQSRHLDGPSPI
jgi:flagellar biosynthetic protein FlhB